MKYRLLIVIPLLLFMSSDRLRKPLTNLACCPIETQRATATFATFSADPAFRNVHVLPTAYEHTKAKGQTIRFQTPDGDEGSAYYVKGNEDSNRYLLVFHEWWGLNDHIKKEADKWAAKLPGVHVMALDLYDGKVATTREEAGKYMQGVSEKRAKAIIHGALNFSGNDADIATIGWCFGGGWSLQAAILAQEQAVGCVMYYGMPEKDVTQLQKLDCDVLGIFAQQDQWINGEVVQEFTKNMEAANRNLSTKVFDAGHAFANPSGDQFNKKAAKEAEAMSFRFLKSNFGV